MRDPTALIFIPIGMVLLYRGLQGLRRGRISWLRGSEDFWMADREDDPVSFVTGVWLHILCGLMAFWFTYWMVF